MDGKSGGFLFQEAFYFRRLFIQEIFSGDFQN